MFSSFIDPPSEGVSSGYESMRCESSANIHSSDSSSEKGKSPMSKGKYYINEYYITVYLRSDGAVVYNQFTSVLEMAGSIPGHIIVEQLL